MIKRGIILMVILLTMSNNANAQMSAVPPKTNTTAFYKQNISSKNIVDFCDFSFNKNKKTMFPWSNYFEKLLEANKPVEPPKIAKPHKQLDVTKSLYQGNPKFLDNFLSNGALKGKGHQFYKAQQKYGINAIFLIAIAQLESGYGKSRLARHNNNFAGMRGRHGWLKFKSVDAGIDAMAENLKRRYVDDGLKTIESINKRYASNKNWSKEIVAKMDEMYNFSQMKIIKYW